jgi:transcriptional regulator with XRE-family HTH domain
VAETLLGERLRQARRARGEDLASLARRTGVRQENLRAIEEGRFSDLPRGIYGRAAVKSFALAYGFDQAEMLAACEPLLPALEEPIAGLARLRGARPFRKEPAAALNPGNAELLQTPATEPPMPSPRWQPVAAAAIDACIVGLMLLVVVICAMTALSVPLSALRHSAIAFGVMGLLLGSGYFIWFGGLAGATVGERIVLPEDETRRSAGDVPVTLAAIVARTVRSATGDVRFISEAGVWLQRAVSARTAPPPALALSPPPARDRGPAPLSPASPTVAGPPPTPRLLRDRTPLRWPSTVSQIR